jgi:group I intron endonuclease
MIDPMDGTEFGYIYKVTNTVNGHIYIGQTLDKIRRRWTNHLATARKNPQWRLHQAIVKYGPDAFTVEEIAQVPGEWLNFVETSYIMMYDSMKSGYNMRMDGSRVSPETREKMRESRKRTPSSSRKGMKNSPEQVEAHRQQMLGRKASEDTKAKMSASRLLFNKNNPGYFKKSDEQKELARIKQTGKRMSPGTLAKMSDAKKGKLKSPATKQRMKDAWKLRKPRPALTDEQRHNLSVSVQAAWDRRKAQVKVG